MVGMVSTCRACCVLRAAAVFLFSTCPVPSHLRIVLKWVKYKGVQFPLDGVTPHPPVSALAPLCQATDAPLRSILGCKEPSPSTVRHPVGHRARAPRLDRNRRGNAPWRRASSSRKRSRCRGGRRAAGGGGWRGGIRSAPHLALHDTGQVRRFPLLSRAAGPRPYALSCFPVPPRPYAARAQHWPEGPTAPLTSLEPFEATQAQRPARSLAAQACGAHLLHRQPLRLVAVGLCRRPPASAQPRASAGPRFHHTARGGRFHHTTRGGRSPHTARGGRLLARG
eukprot:scaffold7342_cov117-Isochrysis_galbana.AAC.3